jgi:hypothetical protein
MVQLGLGIILLFAKMTENGFLIMIQVAMKLMKAIVNHLQLMSYFIEDKLIK